VLEINGTLGVGGCLKNGSLVVLENLEPVAQVGGVVVAGLWGNAEVAAEEGGPYFGNEFFAGVTLVADLPSSEVAVEAGRVLRPVGLMPMSA
jgi:hypothetical protein